MAAFDSWLGRILRVVAMSCLTGLFLLLFVNVVARTFRFAGFAWFDEIVQGLFAWMVFIGAAALWRERDHFQVDWIPNMLAPGARRTLRLATDLLSVCFLFAMTWYGLKLTLSANAVTPILSLPTALLYSSIPVSGAIMLGYSITSLTRLAHPYYRTDKTGESG